MLTFYYEVSVIIINISSDVKLKSFGALKFLLLLVQILNLTI